MNTLNATINAQNHSKYKESINCWFKHLKTTSNHHLAWSTITIPHHAIHPVKCKNTHITLPSTMHTANKNEHKHSSKCKVGAYTNIYIYICICMYTFAMEIFFSQQMQLVLKRNCDGFNPLQTGLFIRNVTILVLSINVKTTFPEQTLL